MHLTLLSMCGLFLERRTTMDLTERDDVDVTDLFWEFVSDVTKKSYAHLCETRGFAALSDAPGRLVLCCSTLGATHTVVPDRVLHDLSRGMFVFPDVTSLLHDTPLMVTDPGMKTLLEECLRRIVCFVDVDELATDLQQHATFTEASHHT